jgi:predicted DNA-binding protein
MGGKRSRPRGDERRDREIHIRITRSELEKLEVASQATDESKSDILRKALKMYLSGVKGFY